MAKVILNDGKEIEVKPAKVGMVNNSYKLYKEEYEREVYVVAQCASMGMDEIEELELDDYRKMLNEAFKLGK